MNHNGDTILIARVLLHAGGSHFLPVDPGLSLAIDQHCIAQFEGHSEWGTVQELSQAHAPPQDCPCESNRQGHVLRGATPDDQEKHLRNLEMEADALTCFENRIRYLHLPLRPLRAIYSFGRERVELLFSAERQIDPRRLIHDMQRELGLHVDLRPLGVRDAAAILGGYGPCGRKLCCASWMDHFRSVNVRMAKLQDLSLNPGAINGMCGRLKCCLRFEYEQYREAAASLPDTGTQVEWKDGHGTVIGRETLRKRLIVRRDDHIVQRLDNSEVLNSGSTPERPPEPRSTENSDDVD